MFRNLETDAGAPQFLAVVHSHSSTQVPKVGYLLDALQNYSAVNRIKNSFTKEIL